MGHTTRNIGGDVESHYIIPPVEEQRQLYLSGYDKLRVQTVNAEVMLRQEVEGLEKEYVAKLGNRPEEKESDYPKLTLPKRSNG